MITEDTEQENTNTDSQSADIAHILTVADKKNIIILIASLSTAHILVLPFSEKLNECCYWSLLINDLFLACLNLSHEKKRSLTDIFIIVLINDINPARIIVGDLLLCVWWYSWPHIVNIKREVDEMKSCCEWGHSCCFTRMAMKR